MSAPCAKSAALAQKRGKMLKRKLGIIFGTMVIFSVVSYILIAAFGRKPAVRGQEERTILTSFYPVYIITQNLTKDMEGVKVVNLTENQTGCLHDYQLTTKDMLLLETADLLVINGGEMELFIEQAVEKLTGLTVIDSCDGISLLTGAKHEHDHGDGTGGRESEENDDHSDDSGAGRESAENDNHSGAAEESAVNGHVWMDTARYLEQIHTVADGLCAAFPGQEAQIRENERSYREKITELAEEYAAFKEQLSGLEVVTFHDAFAYLCDSLGIEVVHGLDLDADSALSAGEIAELTDEIRLHGVRYLFAEKGNGDIAQQVAKETGCDVLYLDPVTSGSSSLDAYLTAMCENLEQLKNILRERTPLQDF